jgi:hypothetical protein
MTTQNLLVGHSPAGQGLYHRFGWEYIVEYVSNLEDSGGIDVKVSAGMMIHRVHFSFPVKGRSVEYVRFHEALLSPENNTVLISC